MVVANKGEQMGKAQYTELAPLDVVYLYWMQHVT